MFGIKTKKKEADADNRWCDTCEFNEFKYLGSECLCCAVYDEYNNLIDLRNYKKEESEVLYDKSYKNKRNH